MKADQNPQWGRGKGNLPAELALCWNCLVRRWVILSDGAGAKVRLRQERLVWGSQTWESKFLGIQFRFLNQTPVIPIFHYGYSYLREQLKSRNYLFRLLVSSISCFHDCEHLTRQKVSPTSHWPGCREPERKGAEVFKALLIKFFPRGVKQRLALLLMSQQQTEAWFCHSAFWGTSELLGFLTEPRCSDYL